MPGSYLITASGLVMNTGAKIVELPGGKITTAGAYGGNQGTAPVLCEGIPMTFDIKKIPPQNIKVFALDNQGERRAELTPAPQNNGSQITFGPENKTLWYEMIISK